MNSGSRKRIDREVAEIDAKIDALAKLKRQRIAQITADESAEELMNREERLEAISDVLAEAIVYLGQRGLLPCKDDALPPDVMGDKGKTAGRNKT